VSSFLSDPFHTFENRLLPSDVILLKNIGEGHEELGERCGGGEDQQGRPTQIGVQLDFESTSAFRTSLQQNGRLGRIRFRFRRSIYG
jgi:hypothetical protein